MATKVYRLNGFIVIEQNDSVFTIIIRNFDYQINSSIKNTETVILSDAVEGVEYEDLIVNIQDENSNKIGNITYLKNYLDALSSEPPIDISVDTLSTVFTIRNTNDLLRTHTLTDGYKFDAKNVMYRIDNNSFDFGIYTLSNITSGVRFGLQGANKGVTSITSTEDNISLIECINQNLLISDLDISATGTGSEAIKMTGTGVEAIDLLNVSFSGATNMGTLESLRQGFWTIGFAFGVSSGFLLKGSWGGFRITSSRFINLQGPLLKGDTGFTIGNVRSDVNIDILASQVAFDFDYDMFTTDEGYQLENGRYTGDGLMVAPFTLGSGADTTETEKSRKSFFKGNKGNLSKNTNIGGAIKVTAETATTLAADTLTELAGTTTAMNLVHMLSNANGELQHNTTSNQCYQPFIDVTLSATANREIKLSLVKLLVGGGLVELFYKTKDVSNFVGNNDVVFFSFTNPCFDLEEGEKVKLYATCIGNSDTVTLLNDSTLYLTAQK